MDAYIIDCSDVTVAFAGPTGPTFALSEINMHVREGEWLALVGRNGSGKSTLGRVLAGLCPVSKGTVRAGRDDVPKTQKIAMVFQNPDAQIVGETVFEDVCFGLENLGLPANEVIARAEQALAQVGLAHKQHDPVEALSGGQKQLLCIASALALQPSILIFDEATSMLSPRARRELLDIVKSLHHRGLTIVWITQWMTELAAADRVMALSEGRIVFDDRPAAFFFPPDHEQASPCTRLGFSVPLTVKVALQLRTKGWSFENLPLTPEALAAEVVSR